MLSIVDLFDERPIRLPLVGNTPIGSEYFTSIGAEIKGAVSPFIDENDKQQDDKNCHTEIAIPSQFRECDCPGDDEYCFDVENDKQHGDEVELRRKAKPGRTGAQDAALIRLLRSVLAMTLPQYKRKAQHYKYQAQNNGPISQYGPQQTSFI